MWGRKYFVMFIRVIVYFTFVSPNDFDPLGFLRVLVHYKLILTHSTGPPRTYTNNYCHLLSADLLRMTLTLVRCMYPTSMICYHRLISWCYAALSHLQPEESLGPKSLRPWNHLPFWLIFLEVCMKKTNYFFSFLAKLNHPPFTNTFWVVTYTMRYNLHHEV